MRQWKCVIAAILLLLTLGTLAACGVEESPETELRLTYVGTPTTLDPAMATTDLERTLIAHLYENLMRPTAEGTAAGIARTYTCTDNLDGTETYTFSLRDGMKWSDGADVTAYDFVYAWKHLVSPDTGSPNREILNMVKGYEQAADGSPEALQVRAEGPLTFTVDLNCHCPYFITSICTDPSTMPVQQSAAQQEDWATRKSTLHTNGAYRLQEWTQQQLVLVADEGYYDEARLNRKELIFSLTDTAEEAYKAYEAGETDFVMGVGDRENGLAFSRPDSTYLIINQMADNLRSRWVRQAMSLAIDRNLLAEQEGEEYIPAAGLVPDGVHITGGNIHFREANGALVDNDPEKYAERCEQAKELMDKAGHRADAAAYYGPITLLYLDTPDQYRCAAQVKKDWQEKLGLLVNIRGVVQEEWQEALNDGEFSVALITAVPRCSDALEYMKDFATNKLKNYGLYSDPAYDILMRTAVQSASREARDAYLEDAEKLLLESGYVIPLSGRQSYGLLREGLTGIFDNGLGVCYFANVREVEEN